MASKLPQQPFDKQVFIDASRVKWSWDAKLQAWNRVGLADDLPLVTEDAIGLLSYSDKQLLDSIPAVGGGFGFIVSPHLLRTSDNPDGTIQGAVKLVSDSLNITCVGPDGEPIGQTGKALTPYPKVEQKDVVALPGGGYGSSTLKEWLTQNSLTNPEFESLKARNDPRLPATLHTGSSSYSTGCLAGCDTPDGLTPGIKFALSDDILSTFFVELIGAKGPRGFDGPKGPRGKEGFTDGPPGDKGLPGVDATTTRKLSGIKVVDLDDVSDSAIVSIEMDSGSGKITYTRSKLNVPEDDTPADQVVALPLHRSISYTSAPFTTLDDWELLAPANDPAGTIDLFVAKIPPNYSSDKPSQLELVRLSDLIGLATSYYSDILCRWEKEWSMQVKEFVESKDEEARRVLSDLTQQVAECEFQLPIEFCLGVEPAQCRPEEPDEPVDPSSGPGSPMPSLSPDCRCETVEFICNQCPFDGISPGSNSIYERTASVCSLFVDSDIGAIRYEYDYFEISDRHMIIGAQGRVIFDSGCAPSGSQPGPPGIVIVEEFNIIRDDDPLTLRVIANCNFDSLGTNAYYFKMTCLGAAEGGPGRRVGISNVITPLQTGTSTITFSKAHNFTSDQIGARFYVFGVTPVPSFGNPEPTPFDGAPNGQHELRSVVNSTTITSVLVGSSGVHSAVSPGTGYAVI